MLFGIISAQLYAAQNEANQQEVAPRTLEVLDARNSRWGRPFQTEGSQNDYERFWRAPHDIGADNHPHLVARSKRSQELPAKLGGIADKEYSRSPLIIGRRQADFVWMCLTRRPRLR